MMKPMHCISYHSGSERLIPFKREGPFWSKADCLQFASEKAVEELWLCARTYPPYH